MKRRPKKLERKKKPNSSKVSNENCEEEEEEQEKKKIVAFCFTAMMNGGPSGFSALILFPLSGFFNFYFLAFFFCKFL
jgi:hypothetical protein